MVIKCYHIYIAYMDPMGKVFMMFLYVFHHLPRPVLLI